MTSRPCAPPRIAGLLSAVWASAILSCAEPDVATHRAAAPRLATFAAPQPAIEGSLVRITGVALELAGPAPQLLLRSEHAEVALAATPDHARGELLFELGALAFERLGPGVHVLEATLAGRGRRSAPVPVALEIAETLPIDLDVSLIGDVHYNTAYLLGGWGYLDAGEGHVEARFTGRFTPDAAAPASAATDVDVSLPVLLAARDDRRQGVVVLRTALGSVHPGTLRGRMSLTSTLRNGARSDSSPAEVDLHFGTPELHEVSPPLVSLGQYVTLRGAGFLGGAETPAEVTMIRLAGTWTPRGGAPTPFLDTVVPEWISGHELRFELAAVARDGELVSAELGSREGRFRGTATVMVASGTTELTGSSLHAELELGPVRQVVHLSFLPGFYDALSDFGLAAAAGAIEPRVQARIEEIYAGFNLEVRLDPPSDFSRNGYARVEIGGVDPSGAGLLGYDNTPGKDVNNLRLFDAIGGASAETQADGAPGYGGVFIQSLLYFSRDPGVAGARPAAAPPVDPLFDEIFDPVRSNPASVDEVLGAGDPRRVAAVLRALDALAAVIGETTAHEVGHSLGLAQPEGSRTAFHTAVPGPGCLMDEGQFRPFGERSAEPGHALTRFCEGEEDYLRRILGGISSR